MLIFYLSLLDNDEEKSKFENLYYEYRSLMKYIAFGILKDDCLSEDAVHNAFLKLSGHLDKIDEINSDRTKGFIVKVVENISKDMYRKRKKDSEIPLDESIYLSVSDDFSLASFGIELIVSKIETLPSIYSDVLVMKYLHELSNKEIANILNIKESTLRKRLERAKILLAEILEKECEYRDLQIK